MPFGAGYFFVSFTAAMRGLQPRICILLPFAIAFIVKGERIKLRNFQFRKAFWEE
jgi:hypothetical protein